MFGSNQFIENRLVEDAICGIWGGYSSETLIAANQIEGSGGRWRLITLSHDGVRVMVDGTTVIENWTWHGPTRDTGLVEQETTGAVEIVVEYFEIDGYAVLEFDLEPVNERDDGDEGTVDES